jgi:hypothetical protein
MNWSALARVAAATTSCRGVQPAITVFSIRFRKSDSILQYDAQPLAQVVAAHLADVVAIDGMAPPRFVEASAVTTVVLPAPWGPTRATVWRAARGGDVVQHRHTRQVAELDVVESTIAADFSPEELHRGLPGISGLFVQD